MTPHPIPGLIKLKTADQKKSSLETPTMKSILSKVTGVMLWLL